MGNFKFFKICFILLLLLLWGQTAVVNAQTLDPLPTRDFVIRQISFEQARVLKVTQIAENLSGKLEDSAGYKVIAIEKIELEISSGKMKRQKQTLENNVTNNPLNIKVQEGDRVVLKITEYNNNQIQAVIVDHYRVYNLLVLGILFLAVAVLIAGYKGLKTFFAILFFFIILMKYYIPYILQGSNPFYLAILFSLLFMCIIVLLIKGFGTASKNIIFVSGIGILLISVFSWLLTRFSYVTGLASEDMARLVSEHPTFNVLSFFFASIVFLGSFMITDLCLTLYDVIANYKLQKEQARFAEMMAMALNVAKEKLLMIGAILLFSSFALSLPLMIFRIYNLQNEYQIFNYDFAEELFLRLLAVLFAVLVTGIVAAAFFALRQNASIKATEQQTLSFK